MVKFSRSEVADLKKFGKGVKEGFGKSPPEGLVPVGHGFYRTPSGPISPKDCNHYPNSPFCGGAGFSKAPIALEPDWGFDECGGYVSITPVLGFTYLPTATLAHRADREGCRPKDPEPPPKKPPPEPGEFVWVPPPQAVPEGDIVFAFIATDTTSLNSTVNDKQCYTVANHEPIVPSSELYTCQWVDYVCPGIKTLKAGLDFMPQITGFWKETRAFEGTKAVHYYWGHCWVKATPTSSTIPVQSSGYRAGGNFVFLYVDEEGGIIKEVWEDGTTFLRGSTNPIAGIIERYTPISGSGVQIVKGQWGLIEKCFSKGTANSNQKKTRHCDLVVKANCKNINPWDKNPPFEPKKRRCCLTCCTPPNTERKDQNLDAILALLRKIDSKVGEFPANATIFDSNENAQEAQTQVVSLGSVSQGLVRAIERIEKVSKIIGIDTLPLTVPDSIVDPIDDNLLGAVWDFFTGAGTRKINNLFEYHVWFLEQFSAVMGQWQMELEIQDTDVLKPGDQGLPDADGNPQPPPKNKKIVLPDIRTALKEQMLLQVGTYKTIGLILDIVLKDLTQDCATYKEVVATQMSIKQIVEFLDYQTDETSVDCTTQITVPGTDVSQEDQNDLGKYLQPGVTKVRYDRWTGRNSLTDLFTQIATLASRGGGNR